MRIGAPALLVNASRPGAAPVSVKRYDLAVDPVLTDPAGEPCQLGLQIDDLVQPRSQRIDRTHRLMLLGGIVPSDATRDRASLRKGTPKMKLQGSGGLTVVHERRNMVALSYK